MVALDNKAQGPLPVCWIKVPHTIEIRMSVANFTTGGSGTLSRVNCKDQPLFSMSECLAKGFLAEWKACMAAPEACMMAAEACMIVAAGGSVLRASQERGCISFICSSKVFNCICVCWENGSKTACTSEKFTLYLLVDSINQ